MSLCGVKLKVYFFDVCECVIMLAWHVSLLKQCQLSLDDILVAVCLFLSLSFLCDVDKHVRAE